MKTYYNFIPYDEVVSLKSFICIYGTYDNYRKRKKPNFFTFNHEDLCITGEEFIKFCKILNLWGFSNTVEIVKEGFICVFPNKDYDTDKQFLTAVTIIRYAVKTSYLGINYGTDKVIHTMFEYKKKHPRLDYFICFQIACYLTMEGKNCPGHSCFLSVSKLVSFKELKEKKFPVDSVNSLFFKELIPEFSSDYPDSWMFKKMHDLINKDEEAALKLLL